MLLLNKLECSSQASFFSLALYLRAGAWGILTEKVFKISQKNIGLNFSTFLAAFIILLL